MSGARRHSRLLSVVREALATALAQPVASAITIVMVAGMCATVLLTTGRTVGAEQRVLGSLDDAGTRSIVVRAQAEAGLDSSVLRRISAIDGVEWATAFGPATDVQNAAFPGGTRVPLRLAWGADLSKLGADPAGPGLGRTAWASAEALEQLGMQGAVGAVETAEGTDYGIAGTLPVPDFLEQLQPVVVSPQSDAIPGRVAVLVVVATRPDLVAPIASAVGSVLAVDDPTKVEITTSEQLATLRALIQGQLGSFGRSLVVVIFAVTSVLVASILYGLVMLRRKDFGRRRALGATRSLIVTLLLTQVASLATFGAVLGCVAAVAALAIANDPLPAFDFTVSVALLAIAVSVAAAVIPAVAASRRDPIRELRVP